MEDEYPGREGVAGSLISRLDPRTKIVTAIGFVLFLVFTPPPAYCVFAGYGTAVAAVLVLSKIRAGFVVKRLLVLAPFLLMVAAFIPFFKPGRVVGGYSFGSLRLTLTYDGLMVLWNVVVKSVLSVCALLVLVGTTPYPQVLRALEKLKCPVLIVMILSFMYRYGFVLRDELTNMRRAHAARTVGGSRWFHVRAGANILGSLFVRSYERGEAVYLAMCARRFEGEIRTFNQLRLATRDFIFLGSAGVILTGIQLLGRCA